METANSQIRKTFRDMFIAIKSKLFDFKFFIVDKEFGDTMLNTKS